MAAGGNQPWERSVQKNIRPGIDIFRKTDSDLRRKGFMIGNCENAAASGTPGTLYSVYEETNTNYVKKRDGRNFISNKHNICATRMERDPLLISHGFMNTTSSTYERYTSFEEQWDTMIEEHKNRIKKSQLQPFEYAMFQLYLDFATDDGHSNVICVKMHKTKATVAEVFVFEPHPSKPGRQTLNPLIKKIGDFLGVTKIHRICGGQADLPNCGLHSLAFVNQVTDGANPSVLNATSTFYK